MTADPPAAAGDASLGLPQPLSVDTLINACDPSTLAFDDTSTLQAQEVPLGQDRVLEAVAFASRMRRSGYNLYVMGSPGVGKHRLIDSLLRQRAAEQPAPIDWCYVANFEQPDAPKALSLPAGRGERLRGDMHQLVEDLLVALPAAFQSSEYRGQVQEIHGAFKEREDKAAGEIAKHAEERGVALMQTSNGYSLAPQQDGKPLDVAKFEALAEEDKQQRQAAMAEIKEELRAVLAKVPLWKREMRQRLRSLNAEITELCVSQLMDELNQQYADLPEVQAYLNAAYRDVVENGELFCSLGDEDNVDADDPRLLRYRVNLLVTHPRDLGAPVIFDNHPTYQNLIGRIEHIAHMGTLSTNFTLIKSGALHRANGGYLVVDIEKLLSQPFAWGALKRALDSEEIRIESVERLIGVMGSGSLEPAPIPLQTKIALIGERWLYYLLKAHDPDFSALFRIVADFSEDMPREPDRELAYAQQIATLQQRNSLCPVSRDGVARIIDWSARRAHDSKKLSLHLGSLTDLLHEADHFARLADRPLIDASAVQEAIEAQTRRSDQARTRLHEAILDDTLLIDTDGRQLGQVNGLVVIKAGDYAFGSPTRISATARMGSGTVIDIETETKLSGAIHSKGVMILSAYLASRYARHQPLSVSASLVFEQSYGEIEGDSASLGELCALLSAIGDLALDQSFAVTGSVNQHGQVQAIGRVNEKIEGFFTICSARGLTGNQGVIIPAANQGDLMLNEAVRHAAAEGHFRVYAVEHTDEVMALLTGMTAGHPDANGLYPEDSCNGRIQRRLIEWTAVRQHFAGNGESG